MLSPYMYIHISYACRMEPEMRVLVMEEIIERENRLLDDINQRHRKAGAEGDAASVEVRAIPTARVAYIRHERRTSYDLFLTACRPPLPGQSSRR
jgi:hypothetical protein